MTWTLITLLAGAIGHELLHAAGECWGDYDPGHERPWWGEVVR